MKSRVPTPNSKSNDRPDTPFPTEHLPASASHRWLVTGVAGFVGSHLLEALLRLEQNVAGLDNFSTGSRRNLAEVRRQVSPAQWGRFRLHKGDISRPRDVEAAMAGAEIVLHQAALGSVPLSLEEPEATHRTNVTGFLNVLVAARQAGVRRVVYASSSAVYGDRGEVPAREERIGLPLSPYALSKVVNEQYAANFERCYGLDSVGLRYFNVFGPRQDPDGPYAAVVPRWIEAMLSDKAVEIFGDGRTSRDFCPVDNVVRANLLAATRDLPRHAPRVFNVGLGNSTRLSELFALLQTETARVRASTLRLKPIHRDFRPGDVRHSSADIGQIRKWLGFRSVTSLAEGLAGTVRWFAGAGSRATRVDPARKRPALSNAAVQKHMIASSSTPLT